jgi:hypothetical protein
MARRALSEGGTSSSQLPFRHDQQSRQRDHNQTIFRAYFASKISLIVSHMAAPRLLIAIGMFEDFGVDNQLKPAKRYSACLRHSRFGGRNIGVDRSTGLQIRKASCTGAHTGIPRSVARHAAMRINSAKPPESGSSPSSADCVQTLCWSAHASPLRSGDTRRARRDPSLVPTMPSRPCTVRGGRP